MGRRSGIVHIRCIRVIGAYPQFFIVRSRRRFRTTEQTEDTEEIRRACIAPSLGRCLLFFPCVPSVPWFLFCLLTLIARRLSGIVCALLPGFLAAPARHGLINDYGVPNVRFDRASAESVSPLSPSLWSSLNRSRFFPAFNSTAILSSAGFKARLAFLSWTFFPLSQT
jgi:hypothetical protein